MTVFVLDRMDNRDDDDDDNGDRLDFYDFLEIVGEKFDSIAQQSKERDQDRWRKRQFCVFS